jgi:hypothetical protein
MVLALFVEKRRSAEVTASANQLHYCIGEGGIREFEKLCLSIGFRKVDYHNKPLAVALIPGGGLLVACPQARLQASRP